MGGEKGWAERAKAAKRAVKLEKIGATVSAAKAGSLVSNTNVQIPTPRPGSVSSQQSSSTVYDQIQMW